MPFMRRLIGGWWKARSSRSVWSIWADPTQISPWPASQKFGGILWANSAHGVSSAGCAGS